MSSCHSQLKHTAQAIFLAVFKPHLVTNIQSRLSLCVFMPLSVKTHSTGHLSSRLQATLSYKPQSRPSLFVSSCHSQLKHTAQAIFLAVFKPHLVTNHRAGHLFVSSCHSQLKHTAQAIFLAVFKPHLVTNHKAGHLFLCLHTTHHT